MKYVPLEKLLERADNSVYKLVLVASKRALEIAEGQPALVEVCDTSSKPSAIALEELIAGKVRIKQVK